MNFKGIIFKEYKELPTQELDPDTKNEFIEIHRSRTPWKTYFIIAILANLATFAFLYTEHRKIPHEAVPQDFAKVYEPKVEYRRVWNHDSAQNWTENNEFWDGLLPAHGLIAVDRKWAAEQKWQESVMLPSDHSKGVYALEAYHQLHCLRTIRVTFWEAYNNKTITWPHFHKHIEHCFEGLRTAIMCNADNTALFTFGGDTIGHGQLRKCRSWDQLRDFATENSACYRVSTKEEPLKDRFGFCDDGWDGMEFRE